jgi:hypothetical protein
MRSINDTLSTLKEAGVHIEMSVLSGTISFVCTIPAEEIAGITGEDLEAAIARLKE